MVKKIKVIVLLVTLSLCLGLMSSTYSRYVASAKSDINVAFSKWQILLNNTDITNGNGSNITIEPVIEENNHVADGKVAPGSKGYFDIDIDPTNVDVSFSYNISLQIEDENIIPDLMIKKYAVIPEDYIEGEELDIIYLDNDTISNSLFYNKNNEDFKFNTFTIRIYFQWYDEDDNILTDEEDSNIGVLAALENVAFTMSANIKFEQIIE